MFKFLANAGSKVLSSAFKAPSPINVVQQPGSLIEGSKALLIPPPLFVEPVRTVIKFSRMDGKRKSVKPVIKRFFRLNWGVWIRTRAGRYRHLWKKSISNRRMLKEHVMCNATQSLLLDRMVSAFWRRPKYYINDPYAPYHSREEFWVTRRKPWRPEGWE